MNRETKDILKAWSAISLAFGIVLSSGLAFNMQVFLRMLLISALTVGLGFLFHELAHRYMARKYKCHAEFRSFDTMLVLAIAMSFFGFVFAAPGAVFISGRVSKKQNGMISAAGPATNIALALAFFAISIFARAGSFLAELATNGTWINAVLALFNMIPFGNFDGVKILVWNRIVYFSIIAVGILVFVIK